MDQIQAFVNLMEWGAYAAIGAFVLSLLNFLTLWQQRGKWQQWHETQRELDRAMARIQTIYEMTLEAGRSSKVPS